MPNIHSFKVFCTCTCLLVLDQCENVVRRAKIRRFVVKSDPNTDKASNSGVIGVSL